MPISEWNVLITRMGKSRQSISEIQYVKALKRVHKITDQPMRRSRKFCQRGSNSANVFLSFFLFFFEGERIEIPLKAGQYWPTSETSFKWRFAGGPMMAQHNTLDARLKDLLFF